MAGMRSWPPRFAPGKFQFHGSVHNIFQTVGELKLRDFFVYCVEQKTQLQKHREIRPLDNYIEQDGCQGSSFRCSGPRTVCVSRSMVGVARLFSCMYLLFFFHRVVFVSVNLRIFLT